MSDTDKQTVNEERRQHRRALGIPVHDTPEEHNFVDGYCTCGESRNRQIEWPRNANHNHSGVRGKQDLSTIEDNMYDR